MKINRRVPFDTSLDSNSNILAGIPKGAKQIDAEREPASASLHIFPRHAQIPPTRASIPKTAKNVAVAINDSGVNTREGVALLPRKLREATVRA